MVRAVCYGDVEAGKSELEDCYARNRLHSCLKEGGIGLLFPALRNAATIEME